MTTFWIISFDLALLTVLVGALYQPRHARPGVAVLLVALNIGAIAVVVTLDRSEVSAGLGLGLFGALAIIRLRSEELGFADIAYVFAALALGLLGGFSLDPVWLGPTLMATLIAGIALIDSPRIIKPLRREQVKLDRALTGAALTERVEALFGHPVDGVETVRLDLVEDSTTVIVTYARGDVEPSTSPDAAGAG